MTNILYLIVTKESSKTIYTKSLKYQNILVAVV